jgi:hypothetical protein
MGKESNEKNDVISQDLSIQQANDLRIWILSFLVLSIVGVPADSLLPAKGSLLSKGSGRQLRDATSTAS